MKDAFYALFQKRRSKERSPMSLRVVETVKRNSEKHVE
jgi:hypothetical protein